MIPLRLARELTHQLDKAGEHERLAKALASVPVFLVLNRGEGKTDVLTLWQQLAVNGFDPEKYYRASLDALRKTTSGLLPVALLAAKGLFESSGKWDLCTELLKELLAWAEERKNEKRMMDAASGLGAIAIYCGNYDEAFTQLNRSLRIAETIDERKGMAAIFGNMGVVYNVQGRYEEAMACYERQFKMADSLGDKRVMSIAIGNMGTVHHEQGRYEEAMGYYERKLKIDESLRNKLGMSIAIGNIGIDHLDQGRYEEAMVWLERYLKTAELLGYKHGMSIAIGNMGIVHMQQGRYDESLVCHERKLKMAESLGDKSGVSTAMGNIGVVHLAKGRHAEALAAFREAHMGHRTIGHLFGITQWLLEIGRTLLDLAAVRGGNSIFLQEAREHATESVGISEDVGRPDTLYSGRILLARIDAAEGNVQLAIEKLEAMLTETTEEEQFADLHYWLWKIEDREESKVAALSAYEALWSRIPKFEFRKRIAELKGERIPMSADDLESS